MNSQLADAVTLATARAIAQVQRDAQRAEELRAAEHRAFMAEERERLADLIRKVDERLAEIQKGNDGKDGEDGQDGVGLAGAIVSREGTLVITLSSGEQRDLGAVVGRDGSDADMEALRAHIDDWIRSVTLPKDGRDGIDVDMDDVYRRVDDYLKAIPIPKDGKDGQDGQDGQSVDMEAVEKTVTQYLEAIPIPKDGEPGRDGIDVDMDAIAIQVKDYLEAIPAPKDGEPGKDGADAYPGSARGLYDPEAEYRALDCVSFNGSEWRAKTDTPGTLPGPGWMLSASKGKRGERGERGPEGKRGESGKDGVSTVGATLDAERMVLLFVQDDGTSFELDFLPVAEAIRTHLQG